MNKAGAICIVCQQGCQIYWTSWHPTLAESSPIFYLLCVAQFEASDSKSPLEMASKLPKPNFRVPTAAKIAQLALFHPV